MALRASFIAAVCLVVGCAPDAVDREHLGQSQEAIVNGTVSSTVQDAAVLLAMPDELCSGTLIAPNLVLTARHCVAASPDGDEECVAYGKQRSPSEIEIFMGPSGNPDINPNADAVAVGRQIIVPQTSNMCSFDVALIILDGDVQGARVAPVRFSPLQPNEPAIAVGYGVDQNDQSPSQRMQRSTTVLGVGPATVPYTTRRGLKVNYNAPDGDIVTGESTCFGDSGGPLFDGQGNIVALTSRGIPQLFPDDPSQFGANGCADQPSVFASVRFNEQIIRQAAQAAGHPLPASTELDSNGKTLSKTNATAGDDEESSDEDSDTPTKKKKKSTVTPQAGAGCAASPHTQYDMAWLIALAAVLATRRKRS